MMRRRGLTIVFWIFVAALPSSISRKRYDIEEECQKTFREDLHTVLQRFRRTPDYYKILGERFNEYITGPFQDTKLQIKRYYKQKVKYKVKELMGIKDEQTTKLTTEAKLDRNMEDFQFKDLLVKKNATPVERLDSYHKLNSNLTVKQKNVMKDLGFVNAGQKSGQVRVGLAHEGFRCSKHYIDELVKHFTGNIKGIEPAPNRTTKKVVWVNKYGEPETHASSKEPHGQAGHKIMSHQSTTHESTTVVEKMNEHTETSTDVTEPPEKGSGARGRK